MLVTNWHPYDQLSNPRPVITTTTNSSGPVDVIWYHLPDNDFAEVPMAVTQREQTGRIKTFTDRGFQVRWQVNHQQETYCLLISNTELGQAFNFYFKSHGELMQWACGHTGVRPSRVLRRVFQTDTDDEKIQQMEVGPSAEEAGAMLDRLTADAIEQAIRNAPKDLEFKRLVDLDEP